MITTLILIVFVLGYTAIAFEHTIHVNKAASALITGVLCWTLFIIQHHNADFVNEELLHHFGEISSILFFLLGAMTIVELVDRHSGFDIISEKINTTSKRTLFFIVTVITFFLSALLDNLTTSILMMSLCSKLLEDKEDRLWFAGMIIIAANAGGVWSPLGDVTTTMLWIGKQVTALNIMTKVFLPSTVVYLLPALLISRRFKGQKYCVAPPSITNRKQKKHGKIILLSGMGFLIFVPVFKNFTHLPPFMGMLLALACMWIVTTILHKDEDKDYVEQRSVSSALQKIDSPSILFFLGILLAVAALQSAGILKTLAALMDKSLHNDYLIGISLGLLSAIVDNVPLVAAAQGMYELSVYPTDHNFWAFLALTTGTGGSTIIIGSAAGVAIMGIEQINFIWYLKKISLFALIGFAAGIIVYILQGMLR